RAGLDPQRFGIPADTAPFEQLSERLPAQRGFSSGLHAGPIFRRRQLLARPAHQLLGFRVSEDPRQPLVGVLNDLVLENHDPLDRTFDDVAEALFRAADGLLAAETRRDVPEDSLRADDPVPVVADTSLYDLHENRLRLRRLVLLDRLKALARLDDPA